MRGEGAAPPSCRRHEKTADGCPRRSHPSRKGEASSAQRFPAFGAARVQDLATSFRGHARAEAVAPLADQVRRLICALRHRLSPSKRPGFGPHTFRSPVSKSIQSPSQRYSPLKSAIIRTRKCYRLGDVCTYRVHFDHSASLGCEDTHIHLDLEPSIRH